MCDTVQAKEDFYIALKEPLFGTVPPQHQAEWIIPSPLAIPVGMHSHPPQTCF